MITGLIRKLKVHVMGLSRNKKLDHFYLLCDSTSKVLDVGVSANEHNNQVNLFLNTFRHSENLYTGLGIETLDKIKKKNPNKRFLEYDGKTFPFNDKEFDWIFSNAVIEHVGNTDQQLHFINEMLRVSKNVFFTTPNKYFPVEAHTNTLFRHWFNRSFYQWCKASKPSWSKKNLLLISSKDINNLMKNSNAVRYKIFRNRMLLYTMTFTIICNE